jgi:hypothetical protein
MLQLLLFFWNPTYYGKESLEKQLSEISIAKVYAELKTGKQEFIVFHWLPWFSNLLGDQSSEVKLAHCLLTVYTMCLSCEQ